MNVRKNLVKKIAQKFGTVKRCRGCFLYTAKGTRLTDLWQEDGRAILGWGAKGTFTILKNVLERGITGSFYTDFSEKNINYKSQLSRAVSALFAGDRTAFVFSSKNAALKAALSVSQEGTSVYRPWNNQEIDWRNPDCIIFVPALPWTDEIYILAVKDELAGVNQDTRVSDLDFPEEAHISAPVCAAVTRSVYDLIKALQVREEKNWFIYDKVITKYWTRKGPYLYPKIPQEKYEEFVEHCLECELVINPDYTQPSIVPFGADAGVFRKLEKNPYAGF